MTMHYLAFYIYVHILPLYMLLPLLQRDFSPEDNHRIIFLFPIFIHVNSVTPTVQSVAPTVWFRVKSVSTVN